MYSNFMFLFLFLVASVRMDADFRCSKELCQDYIESDACPDITECMKKKHILMDIAEPCNCCKMCLILLEENEECDPGEIGQVTPNAICGAGLQCINKVCQLFDTPCSREQIKWDNDQSSGVQGGYILRPECDEYGKYTPGYCQPSTGICFCINEDGKRIHGEIVFENLDTVLNLTCECSRMVDTASTLLSEWSFSLETVRCTAAGEYESVQCIEDKCLCVDPNTGGIQDNHFISQDTIKKGDLPCYPNDTTLTLERPCEDEKRALIRLKESLEKFELHLLDATIPTCTPDGRYDRVQIRNGSKLCVDPQGKLINSYEISLDSNLAVTMNCKCARAEWLVRRGPYPDYTPQCLNNGNFHPLQCRREWCFCVDDEGSQLEMEVPPSQMNTLSCYKVDKMY